jgi:iron(III) transport system permease protein
MNASVPLTSTRTERALDRLDLQTWLFVLALAAALFLVAYPIFLVIINSFRVAPPGQPPVFGFDGWRTALSEPGMRSSIYNTLALVLVRQAIAFPIAILVTWIIARTDIPWRGALEFMFWLSFFLPSLSVTLGWILLLAPEYGILNRAWTKLFQGAQGPFDIYSFGGLFGRTSPRTASH